MPPLSIFIPHLYAALPIIVAAVAVLRSWRAKNFDPVRVFFVGAIAGAVGGFAVALIYLRGLHGSHIPTTQIAITCYWGISIAFVLRGANAALSWIAARITPTGPDGRPRYPAVDFLATICRAAVLIAFIVPYVGAMLLMYRPHVVNPGTPRSILNIDYQDVTFFATDGVRLGGWWIPATQSPSSDTPTVGFNFGDRTVIVCHGFGADKASDLRMARDLTGDGYNILAFDFRAHGESAGQLTTFGKEESRDVIGAVRWARKTHPEQTRKIFGLGESLGAAALIGAAVDPQEGQFIDAVAIYAPFDRLSTLIQDVADSNFAPSAGWMATHLALPIAGAQLGCKLDDFSPASLIDRVAPRPVLVIASEEDRSANIGLSKELYERASQPKYAYWIKKGDRPSMLFEKSKASLTVRVFFATAHKVL